MGEGIADRGFAEDKIAEEGRGEMMATGETGDVSQCKYCGCRMLKMCSGSWRHDDIACDCQNPRAIED